jgi:asparagine synthase (glutamine-hydrolysing)
MARQLAHRGPDAMRVRMIAGGGLVSTRLAITDPAGAQQPFTDCSAAVVCVYNGEIYNYRELRAQLTARGHRLRGNGDGEVIAHLYEEYGTDFLHHLRGAFAIALYDTGRDELILARDRMGEKPLVYATTGGVLSFASEIRALTPGEVSPGALARYLRYGFVPEPETLFSNIRKLPAGHYAVVRRTGGLTIALHRYWSLPAAGRDGAREATVVDRQRSLFAAATTFATAVEQQSRADVPIALALSGGVDSTLLAHVGANSLPDFRTYSVGFEWMPPDELDAAAATAQELQSKHSEIRLDVDDYLQLLIEGSRGLSEPIADWTMPAYLALSSRCRDDGVRVLLTGHGPDELFLAYRWTLQAGTAIRSALGAGNASVDPYRFNPEYAEAVGWATDLLGAGPPAASTEPFADCPTRSTAEFRRDLRNLLLRGYLRSNGLMQLDSLGLMNAVEIRVPYVDYRFVEAAIALDDLNPAFEPVPKHHLYAMARLLGAPCHYVEKRPFFPLLDPLRAPISLLASDVLLSGELVRTSLVSAAAVRRLLSSAAGSGNGINVMFRLLLLELWISNLRSPAV